MILEQHPDVQRLSPSEKFLLVGELWDDLVAHPQEVPVSRAILEELERRAEEYRQHPERVSPWSDVKARILAKKQS